MSAEETSQPVEQPAVVETPAPQTTEAPKTEATEREPVAKAEGAEGASDADKPAEGDKSAADRDEKGRFKGVQPRIDELTRQRREAEREAAYWRAKASGGETEAAKAAAVKPTPDKFTDYGEYVEALTDWKAKQAAAEMFQQQAQARQQDTRSQTWIERQTAARVAMPDYDEVVGSATTPLAPHVADAIVDSDVGPALAYHFAKNPDTLVRLNGLPPMQAAREMGRIEASLAPATTTTAAAPAIARTTSAPKPAATSAAQGRSSSRDPNSMSFDEYTAFRRTQGARWAR